MARPSQPKEPSPRPPRRPLQQHDRSGSIHGGLRHAPRAATRLLAPVLLLLVLLPASRAFSNPRLPPQFDPLPPRGAGPRPQVLLHDWTAQGLAPYEQAWAAQHAVLDRRLALRQRERDGAEEGNGGGGAGRQWRGDRLLLLQHPPTYTLGTGSTPDNLKFDPTDQSGAPAALFRTERGGEATWHGPGQVM